MYGFEDIPENKRYLRTAGKHIKSRFVSLKYDATEEYEYFDIELETENGETFRERTFAPNIDKIFPKKKYKHRKVVGEETKEEALERVNKEISAKLFYLGKCFVEDAKLREAVAKASDFKELVDKLNKAINSTGNVDNPINFLTVWKNSDQKQRSTLIIPERTFWVEPYVEGKSPTIQFNPWQLENQMTEKYPFNGNGEVSSTDDAIVNASTTAVPIDDDLPF